MGRLIENEANEEIGKIITEELRSAANNLKDGKAPGLEPYIMFEIARKSILERDSPIT